MNTSYRLFALFPWNLSRLVYSLKAWRFSGQLNSQVVLQRKNGCLSGKNGCFPAGEKRREILQGSCKPCRYFYITYHQLFYFPPSLRLFRQVFPVHLMKRQLSGHRVEASSHLEEKTAERLNSSACYYLSSSCKTGIEPYSGW